MAINLIRPATTSGAAGRTDRHLWFKASTLVLAIAVPAFAWTLWASHSKSASTAAQAAFNVSLSELLSTVTTAQSSMRGYVLSGTDAFLGPYRQSSPTTAGSSEF